MTSSRYEIQQTLGQGGSGVVYKALDVQLQRLVAIKRLAQPAPAALPAGAADTPTHGTAESLRQEALALSSLQHPNIVTVHDIGTDEEGPYVVMEHLEGQTLEQVVEGAPLPLEEFTTLVQDTLSGLGAAHARGLLHRDVKPSNIMLVWLPTHEMRFKLLDFGIAKHCPAPASQTTDVEGGIMGSIYFMAPEQFERAPLDVRTDLYALGCTFFHALTGCHPFHADTAAGVMAAHLQHAPGPLAEWRPDLPPAVVDWVLKLMSRRPEDRPDTAAQALALFRLAKDSAGEPPPPPPVPDAVASPKTALPDRPSGRGPQVVIKAPPPVAPATGGKSSVLSILVPLLLFVVLATAAFAWHQWQEAKKKFQAPEWGKQVVSNLIQESATPPRTTPEATPPPADDAPLAEAVSPASFTPPAQEPAMVPPLAPEPTPAPPVPAPATMAMDTGTAALPPTALDQLRSRVNETVEVEGTVTGIGESKSGKTRYVNFTRRPGESVSLAFRTVETEALFPKSRLESWVGQKLRAKGVLTEFNGGLLIYIKDEADVHTAVPAGGQ